MNLVVDTHALLWFLAGETGQLSARARRAFARAEAGESTLHVPVLVLVELVLLESRGRIRMSYADLRRALASRPGMPVEPLIPEDVDEARALSDIDDPFDRLIASTALRLGLPLLTRDARLSSHPRLRTIW